MNLYAVGTHIDLRKDKTAPRDYYIPNPRVPGTHVKLWLLRQAEFMGRMTVLNITNNPLASA